MPSVDSQYAAVVAVVTSRGTVIEELNLAIVAVANVLVHAGVDAIRTKPFSTPLAVTGMAIPATKVCGYMYGSGVTWPRVAVTLPSADVVQSVTVTPGPVVRVTETVAVVDWNLARGVPVTHELPAGTTKTVTFDDLFCASPPLRETLNGKNARIGCEKVDVNGRTTETVLDDGELDPFAVAQRVYVPTGALTVESSGGSTYTAA